jgi:protein TonB
MEGQKPAWMRWGGVALGLGVAVMLGLGLKDLLVSDKPAKKPKLQQITLVKPPPPPPPEKKPPEPEIKKEEVKIDQPPPDDAPKPADNAPPAGKDLGVDADGSAGGDGFGLVGRKGGRDLLGGAGGKFAGYTTLQRQQIQEFQTRDKRLRSTDYKVVVRIWIARDGHVEKFDLVGSTGIPDTDNLVKQVLASLPSMKEQPPEDMPQPIKLRITSRL